MGRLIVLLGRVPANRSGNAFTNTRLLPSACSGQKAPNQPGPLAMSDTPTPSPTEAKRRYGAPQQKVPPFARYEGTLAWHKDRRRVRAYARFHAVAKQASQTPGTPKP